MAIPASGTFNSGQIRTELNKSGTFTSADARVLSGKSGGFSTADLRGKSLMSVTHASLNVQTHYVERYGDVSVQVAAPVITGGISPYTYYWRFISSGGCYFNSLTVARPYIGKYAGLNGATINCSTEVTVTDSNGAVASATANHVIKYQTYALPPGGGGDFEP